MKKTVEKKATLAFKKGLEVMETGLFFDLEDKAEISLDEEIKQFFEVGDVIKLTITKSQPLEEE